jgi:cell division protease FtsH
MFEKAMQNAPSVLVIDEMEAFLADRETGGGGSHHRVEEVAEFLRRIPEAAKNEVLIVAMTNRVEMIDSAIMRRGRFDHVIKVDYANEDEVLALLGKLLATLPKDKTVDAGRWPRSWPAARFPTSPSSCAREPGLPPAPERDKLGQEFLLAALEDTPSRSVAEFMSDFGDLVDSIEPEAVLRDVNGDSAIAGFPEVRGIDLDRGRTCRASVEHIGSH